MFKLQRQKTSDVDVAIIFTELKLNLQGKRVKKELILEKREKNREVNARFFFIKLYAFTRNVNHTWMSIEMPTKV